MPCFRGPLGCPGADGGAVVDDAHDPFFASERAFKASTVEGEAVSSRLARASAEKEIDESAGKFLRPRRDIAHFELLAYASRAN
jgi:hypothetical protein